MGDGCDCGDADIVAVSDRNMAPVYVPGNPYSRFCLNCGRRYFCSDTFWKDASEPYVIPKGEDEPIPLSEYGKSDEFDENAFQCPADGCDHPQFGKPAKCDACGTEYQWTTNE
jgi:hypothetical protein